MVRLNFFASTPAYIIYENNHLFLLTMQWLCPDNRQAGVAAAARRQRWWQFRWRWWCWRLFGIQAGEISFMLLKCSHAGIIESICETS